MVVGMECVKASCFSSGTKMAVGGAADFALKGEMDAAIVSNVSIVGGINLVNLSKTFNICVFKRTASLVK